MFPIEGLGTVCVVAPPATKPLGATRWLYAHETC